MTTVSKMSAVIVKTKVCTVIRPRILSASGLMIGPSSPGFFLTGAESVFLALLRKGKGMIIFRDCEGANARLTVRESSITNRPEFLALRALICQMNRQYGIMLEEA